MESLVLLSRTLAFSLAAGINLYATVALLGLSQRFGWVTLPSQFQVFDNDAVIAVASVMFVIEFFADKIPWLDSAWDAIHSFVRPLGGALIAVAALGHASPTVTVFSALLGGTLAASSHMTKAGTRVLVNASPEPFTNWTLSLAEDGFVLGLGYLALHHPIAALIIVAVALALMTMFAAVLFRAARRRLRRRRERLVAGGVS